MSRRNISEELAALKAEWLANPYWVLENTDGFDEHRAELRQFRLDTHAQQERYRAGRLIRSVIAHETEAPDFPIDVQSV